MHHVNESRGTSGKAEKIFTDTKMNQSQVSHINGKGGGGVRVNSQTVGVFIYNVLN